MTTPKAPQAPQGLTPNFQHDCPEDILIGVINDTLTGMKFDIYAQCGGRGYIVRFGNEGPDYISLRAWSLESVFNALGQLVHTFPRLMR